MQRLQAFKYELHPTGEQDRLMRRFAGACRFVFNKALALQKANHEAGLNSCQDSSDHWPIRSWPLLRARRVMREVMSTLQ